jgi:hypothetical protein
MEKAKLLWHRGAMKQYRPNVERAKWLYSMEQSRAWVRRRQGRKSRAELGLPPIPDNSEPWLPGGVRSVADALWISDRIKETVQQWGIKLPQQD